VDLEPPRRRYRPLLGVSGVVLFVCLFLPALRVCSHDDTPAQYPMLWPPHVFGLVFAVCSLVTSDRVRLALARTLAYLCVAGMLLLMAYSFLLGGIELVLALVIAFGFGTDRREIGLAHGAIVVGMVSTGWFALLASSSDALYGSTLSLCASLALLAAGFIWRGDIAADPPVPPIPRAIAREVG
jgi:hypothetical protein